MSAEDATPMEASATTEGTKTREEERDGRHIETMLCFVLFRSSFYIVALNLVISNSEHSHCIIHSFYL